MRHKSNKKRPVGRAPAVGDSPASARGWGPLKKPTNRGRSTGAAVWMLLSTAPGGVKRKESLLAGLCLVASQSHPSRLLLREEKIPGGPSGWQARDSGLHASVKQVSLKGRGHRPRSKLTLTRPRVTASAPDPDPLRVPQRVFKHEADVPPSPRKVASLPSKVLPPSLQSQKQVAPPPGLSPSC